MLHPIPARFQKPRRSSKRTRAAWDGCVSALGLVRQTVMEVTLGLALGLPLVWLSTAPAQAQTPTCGDLKNGFGPYDFLTDKDRLPVVEQHHFTPEVEMLIKGHTSVDVGSDLSYTLLVFPNHHRALQAMVRLGARLRTPQPPGAAYPVACYFERALRFRPHDTTARLLFANYLFQNQRKADAMAQMTAAAQDAGDNPFTHYNMGLMYLENQEPERAREQAHRAYDQGFQLPGLQEQLERLGRWP